MPLFSLGGMRFQQSWKDLPAEEITNNSQKLLEAILKRAFECGLSHLETARHYGSSEFQLGKALNNFGDTPRLLQTKVPPSKDITQFEKELKESFEKLGCEKLDLLAIHGINLYEHLDETLRPGGCLEVVRRWQDQGLISHVGFSTHGPTELIVKAIKTDAFDFVNLHWYFIFQENEVALQVAKEFDLGVFIISPTDKGGHLHTPSQKMLDLCKPLHPIVFNDLFCLRDQRVHTISVGASQPEDLELHLEAISLLDSIDIYLPVIEQRLHEAAFVALGEHWLRSWNIGLPTWQKTPGGINIPILLWLHNLIEAWDLEDYARARYSLLGNASHWFPGSNADCLDYEVSEEELLQVLIDSPWSAQIPGILRRLRGRIGGCSQERLSTA